MHQTRPLLFRLSLSAMLLAIWATTLGAQIGTVAGRVTNADSVAAPLPGVEVLLEGTSFQGSSGSDGSFRLRNVPSGTYTLLVRYIGYAAVRRPIEVRARAVTRVDVALSVTVATLEGITVTAERVSAEIEASGFSVEAVETRQLRNQSLDMNAVLDRAAGVRVRQSGGAGSDFSYSIHGLTGRSVRFFVDGIPMDVFGSAYNISNFPVSFVERAEVYKGVVPVELGSDALGGAVNLVTRPLADDFLEASYGFGSFGTHQGALHGAWHDPRSRVAVKASAFLTSSRNDYEVWGPGITVADEDFRPVAVRASRFNDRFRAMTGKVDVGVEGVPWADQAYLGLVVSDLDKGIQHGQTMSQVFGEARYAERLYLPTLTFVKQDALVRGLAVRAFASYAMREGVTVDTSRRQYDWQGRVIATAGSAGEIARGSGGSLLTLSDDAQLYRLNASYDLSSRHALGFNTLVTAVRRQGEDPLAPWYSVPFVEPQRLRKVVSGLTYQSSWLDDRLVASLFGKHYRYSADVNEGVLVADSAGQQIYVSRTVQNRESDLGLGGAVRYRLLPTLLLKLSAEQSRRLPESEEALGNGNTITNSPGLRPERSRNLNLGVRLDRLAAGAHDFALASSVFLRETDDLILLTVIDGQGTGQFQNVAESGGWGVEGEVSWRWGARVEATVQGTYLDLRNRQRLTSAGVRNTVYGDRLRNTPFLFGNANLQVRLPRLPVLGDDATAYWNAGWVREFYLNWPSVGAAGTKAVIPSQLVHDVGASVTLLRAGEPEGRTIMTAGLDVQNVFDVRVYDNYLLQRPGRSVAVKLRASL